MIDTITLLIPAHNVRIMDYDAFTPSARPLFKPPYYKGFVRCIHTTSKRGYNPRLSLTRRALRGGVSVALKIEFSIPKIFFGNNFQELENTDFPAVVNVLHRQLITMGIETTPEALAAAEVVGIHFGKNIILENSPVSSVIKALGKLDISKRLDAATSDFRNDGQAIRYHANAYEVCFYDKIKDLQQSKISEKRAYESDNAVQHHLALCVGVDVLRMELRLNTKKKIRDVLQKTGTAAALQFNTLFNKDISRRALVWFWQQYVEPSQTLLFLQAEDKAAVFHRLKCAGYKDAKIMQIIGLHSLLQDESLRAFKAILSNRKYYKNLQKDVNLIDDFRNPLYNDFVLIKRQLDVMQSIRNIDLFKNRSNQ